MAFMLLNVAVLKDLIHGTCLWNDAASRFRKNPMQVCFVAVSSYGCSLQRGSKSIWCVPRPPSPLRAAGRSAKSRNAEEESRGVGQYVRVEVPVVRARLHCSSCFLFQPCKCITDRWYVSTCRSSTDRHSSRPHSLSDSDFNKVGSCIATR
jgi:hypothetical protein